MNDDIVYFELNSWSEEYWPMQDGDEPYLTWLLTKPEGEPKDSEATIFEDEKWVKDNKLCVVMWILDMSFDYLITAKKSWVEENCPDLLTKFKEFLRYPDEDGNVYGRCNIKFKEYSDENIGITYGDWIQ